MGQSHVSAADKTAHLTFLENAKRDVQPVLLKVPEQWFNVASALTGAVEASVCATASWADEVAGLDKERLYAYTPLLDHENGSIQIGAMMYHHGGQQHITLDVGLRAGLASRYLVSRAVGLVAFLNPLESL